MNYIHRIVHEISDISGLSFDLVEVMENAFNEMREDANSETLGDRGCTFGFGKGIQPLPSASTIRAFFGDLRDHQQAQIPGCGMSLKQFGKLWRIKEQGSASKADEAVLKTSEAAAFYFSDQFFMGLTLQYGSWPILEWFVQVLSASLKVRKNFTLWAYRWGTARGLQRSESRMLWLALGSSLLTACETECLKDSDVRRISLKATDDMSQQVLQKLTLELIRLKAAMTVNVETALRIRNKTMAIGVTLGISVGQFLASYLSQKLSDSQET